MSGEREAVEGALRRVSEWLRQRRRLRGLDPEVVNTTHGDLDAEPVELLVSDLVVLTALAARAGGADEGLRAAVEALDAAADALDDEEVAFNVILGGPSYVAYWLRARAATLSPTAAAQVATMRAIADEAAAAAGAGRVGGGS